MEEFKGVVHNELPKGLPPMRDIQYHISKASLPKRPHYQMNLKESEVLKEMVRLKLEKINARYKAATDKKRRKKLFEERNVMLSKIFNMTDLYEHHPIE